MLNLPNRLTLSRFVLAVAFFVLVGCEWWDPAFVAFVLAGITDLLDGYYARKRGQTTDFGRVADPFVDKIIICGGFIYLVQKAPTFVHPWIAIVITAREFAVTSLRGYVESKGVKFGATIWGKSKMALQFTAISVILLVLGHFHANDGRITPAIPQLSAHAQQIICNVMTVLTHVLIYVAVLATTVSGVRYIVGAGNVLKREDNA